MRKLALSRLLVLSAVQDPRSRWLSLDPPFPAGSFIFRLSLSLYLLMHTQSPQRPRLSIRIDAAGIRKIPSFSNRANSSERVIERLEAAPRRSSPRPPLARHIAGAQRERERERESPRDAG